MWRYRPDDPYVYTVNKQWYNGTGAWGDDPDLAEAAVRAMVKVWRTAREGDDAARTGSTGSVDGRLPMTNAEEEQMVAEFRNAAIAKAARKPNNDQLIVQYIRRKDAAATDADPYWKVPAGVTADNVLQSAWLTGVDTDPQGRPVPGAVSRLEKIVMFLLQTGERVPESGYEQSLFHFDPAAGNRPWGVGEQRTKYTKQRRLILGQETSFKVITNPRTGASSRAGPRRTSLTPRATRSRSCICATR